MAQSLHQIYMHIIFSTKNREHLIQPEIESELHGYMSGICKKLGYQVIIIGGYTDHVHILCMQSNRVLTTKLLEVLKSSSSLWIKTKGDAYKNFYWQNGYGAFSVDAARLNSITKYIANQHEHHSKVSFETEFREIAKRHRLKIDERYVWD